VKRHQAFTIGELIIVLIIIGILAAIAIPNFLEGSYRSPVTKVKSASRSLATAIEAYYVEHKAYPAMRPMTSFTKKAKRLSKVGGLTLMSIEPGRPDIGLAGLTTPVAFISELPMDECAQKNVKLKVPLAYYTDDNGWILFSPGNDKDYDLNPARDYDSSIPQPSEHLIITATYDPTNGTNSDGDVWRVKQ
jgi:prepilin-type N-terminal cleavage/methylation domain-containing protein